MVHYVMPGRKIRGLAIRRPSQEKKGPFSYLPKAPDKKRRKSAGKRERLDEERRRSSKENREKKKTIAGSCFSAC